MERAINNDQEEEEEERERERERVGGGTVTPIRSFPTKRNATQRNGKRNEGRVQRRILPTTRC